MLILSCSNAHSDWLRDRVFFDGLEHDDGLSMARLGFKAPNILVMSLTQ